jgi:hypothetical protein
MIPLLSHSGEGKIRLASARAMAGGMKVLPGTAAGSILLLKGLFHSHKPVPAASSGRMLAPIGMCIYMYFLYLELFHLASYNRTFHHKES